MAMLKILKIISCLFIITAMGCAANMHHHAGHHHEQTSKITETIKPSGMHEDCIELMPSQILDYSFESSNRVNFNIHYHENSDIIYFTAVDNTSKEYGSFNPKKKQYYCLMWTNPSNESISITYTYNVRKSQK